MVNIYNQAKFWYKVNEKTERIKVFELSKFQIFVNERFETLIPPERSCHLSFHLGYLDKILDLGHLGKILDFEYLGKILDFVLKS